jgi:hypothetical protein
MRWRDLRYAGIHRILRVMRGDRRMRIDRPLQLTQMLPGRGAESMRGSEKAIAETIVGVMIIIPVMMAMMAAKFKRIEKRKARRETEPGAPAIGSVTVPVRVSAVVIISGVGLIRRRRVGRVANVAAGVAAIIGNTT